MMQHQELPETTLAKLKCTRCEHFLSVPPITMSENGKLFCGRCKVPGQRNTAYEELSRYMIFPCINQYCTKKLLWDDVCAHENVCSYRFIECPAFGCKSKIRKKDLVLHFQANHGINCYNNSVELRYKMNSDIIVKEYLMDCNGAYYIALLHVGPKQRDPFYKIWVFSINEFQSSTYTIHLKRYMNNLGMVPHADKKGTLDFEKYLDGSYQEADSFDNLRFDHSNEVWGKIVIRLDDVNKFDEANQNHTDVSMEEILECPVCNEYMSGYIYLCIKGHSFCEQCKPKLQRCPFCQDDLADARNYQLETVAKKFKN